LAKRHNSNIFQAGSLFYSIVIISTIGYGDQTPKTQWGKVILLVQYGNLLAQCYL
jgi:hypothetical protein